MVYTATTGPLTEIPVEADLGMFSMSGRTGAPHKKGAAQKDKKIETDRHRVRRFYQSGTVHCSTGPQQNVDDDYCACRVKAVGGGGYSVFIY